MKFLPQNRDEQVSFILLPFKVLVVALPVWQMAALVGISDRLTWQYFEGRYLSSWMAMICLPVLLLGALVQAAFCSRGKVWWTLGFLGFGFLFGPPGRFGFSASVSQHVSLALSAVVAGFALAAYRKLKWRMLLLVAGGTLLSIAVRLVYEFVGPAGTVSDARRVVWEVGPAFTLLAQALITVGLVQLLQKLMSGDAPKSGLPSDPPK